MAIRYSGDAEVRVRWDAPNRRYEGRVSDPYLVWRGYVLTSPGRAHTSSGAFDRAAIDLLRAADRWAKAKGKSGVALAQKDGKIILRRASQSPCPFE